MSRKPANAGSGNRSINDSVDAEEIAYFDDLADKWWDPAGPFAALQRMTPARVAYIRRHARRLLTTETGQPSTPLSGLTILDIGCGGGLLAEALQRLGASVTGIDAGAEAIAAARRHAAASGLDIDYRAVTAESLADEGEVFDIIIASEVIEHVADRPAFLATMARFGKPDGTSMVVLTTINRSLPGVVLGKYAAEYLLRLAPRGAHDPKRFVRPEELRREARDAGINIDDITGIQPSLFGGGMPAFSLGGPPLINYAATGLISSGTA